MSVPLSVICISYLTSNEVHRSINLSLTLRRGNCTDLPTQVTVHSHPLPTEIEQLQTTTTTIYNSSLFRYVWNKARIQPLKQC